ncbi:hypothetical protein M9H77_26765 [Catharanthus roseus]|uniref:Uncharacterized protein n=1 Tax=Catharanthus roseus TaxID=4058 RepID=A0ACC0AAJ4_CATRO|nr:hypothetical protein M9H77_26765 [Catharanthus roseus]
MERRYDISEQRDQEEPLERCTMGFSSWSMTLKRRRPIREKKRLQQNHHWLLRNLNIMNESTSRLVMNGVAKKEFADKYKKELEITRREQAIALDQVAALEEKISKLEAPNIQLSETNVNLSKINKRLIDECFVKDGRIESLNETLAQVQQDTTKYKEEAEQTRK